MKLLKCLAVAILVSLSVPVMALRSPIPNPGPVQRQTYYSTDLATAPAGLYVRAFDLSWPPNPYLYHFAGGGTYILTANGSMQAFIPSDWPDTLWVPSPGGAQ